MKDACRNGQFSARFVVFISYPTMRVNGHAGEGKLRFKENTADTFHLLSHDVRQSRSNG